MNTIFAIIVLLCSVLSTTALSLAQTSKKVGKQKTLFVIEVARKIKAFDKYFVTSTYTMQTQMKAMMNGIALLDTTDQITLRAQADVEILGVTEDGQEADKQLVIRNFQKSSAGGFIDVLPTGTRVKAMHSNEGDKFSVNGKPVADSIAAMLTSVFRAEGGEKTSKIIGTSKKQSVGSSWKINSSEFLKNLPDGLSQKAKISKGKVMLKSVDTTANPPEHVVEASIVTENIADNIADIPTRSSSLTTTITLRLPNDVRRPPIAITTKQVFEADTLPAVEQGGVTTVLTTTTVTDTVYQR